MYTLEDIQAVDPEIAAAITAEFDRQNRRKRKNGCSAFERRYY